MKPFFVFVSVAVAVVILAFTSLPQRSTAQNLVAPLRYRVVDTVTIPLAAGRTPAESIEALLNDMSAKGWRMDTISGPLIVFSSP